MSDFDVLKSHVFYFIVDGVLMKLGCRKCKGVDLEAQPKNQGISWRKGPRLPPRGYCYAQFQEVFLYLVLTL